MSVGNPDRKVHVYVVFSFLSRDRHVFLGTIRLVRCKVRASIYMFPIQESKVVLKQAHQLVWRIACLCSLTSLSLFPDACSILTTQSVPPPFPNWVLPEVPISTRKCSCQNLAPMSNSWSTSGRLDFVRALGRNNKKKQHEIARARSCTQSCSKVGQLLANSRQLPPSHGKLPGFSLQWSSGNTLV